ncbi:MAG: NADH-ubiquinone oxidoreductase-F iron-sulfur binding region domain-containing protein [Hyphomicrobiales bacterium]
MGIFKRKTNTAGSRQAQATRPTGPFFCGGPAEAPCITVCSRTGQDQCPCGCEAVRSTLVEEIRFRELNVRVAAMKVGCNGACPYGPLVGFPGGSFYYHGLTPERAREVVAETIEQGHILFDLLHLDPLHSTSGRLLYDHASGFIAVLDEGRCMVQVAKYFLDFDKGVSCGKCTPCRAGFVYLRELVDAIAEGEGRPEDLHTIQAILAAMRQAAYCEYAGRGSGPLAVILKHFRPEFELHVNQKLCPAGECTKLGRGKLTDERP